MGKGTVGEEVKLKATTNRWIEAVGSHLKVAQCENTGKQEGKDELFTSVYTPRVKRMEQNGRFSRTFMEAWQKKNRQRTGGRQLTSTPTPLPAQIIISPAFAFTSTRALCRTASRASTRNKQKILSEPSAPIHPFRKA